MIRKILLLSIACLFCAVMYGQQQVVATSGNFDQNSSGSLSWTLGELAIETYTSSSSTITQGFHQSRITVTSVGEYSENKFTVTAFPNPTQDFVHLKMAKGTHKKFTYYLFDIKGRLLFKNSLELAEAEISFEALPPATYLVKVYVAGREIKALKIIKQ